jgi:outer membrane protein OmpA-like peptidoglycan-associated protein
MTDPRHAARYRKGVILGLTIAEVFALIVFLLLIMLAVHGELKRKAEEVATIARQLDALSPAQLALMADPAALDRAVRLLAVVRNFEGGTRTAEDALKALALGGVIVPKGTVQLLAQRLARLPDSELALLSEDLAFNDALRLLKAARLLPGPGPVREAETALRTLARGGDVVPAGPLRDVVATIGALPQHEAAQLASDVAAAGGAQMLRRLASLPGGLPAVAAAVEKLSLGGILLPPPPPGSDAHMDLLANALVALPADALRALAEGPPIGRLAQLSELIPANKFDLIAALMTEADALPGGLEAAGLAISSLAAGGRIIDSGSMSTALAGLEALATDDRERFAADGGIEEAATYLAALADLTAPQREAALAEVSRGDLVDALAREAEVSASDRLEQALGQARARMAEAVGAKLAAVVARSDGVVDASDGAITFSRDTLFGQGEDSVGPAQARVLDEICAPWIEALCSSSGNVIGEIRIEGHASSEWDTDSERIQAYLKNLELSQKRASAVLAYCLGKMSGPIAMVDWARGRMVAIGHSSSRVILDPATGAEDRELSRRVVLRADIDRDRLLDQDAGARSTAPACSGG